MPRFITPADLARSTDHFVVVDVRREAARTSSGRTIAGALRIEAHDPDWLRGLKGRPVLVFCVHGHDVSQDACRSLVAAGVDARYLGGGFEAWCLAGLPTVRIEEAGR